MCKRDQAPTIWNLNVLQVRFARKLDRYSRAVELRFEEVAGNVGTTCEISFILPNKALAHRRRSQITVGELLAQNEAGISSNLI